MQGTLKSILADISGDILHVHFFFSGHVCGNYLTSGILQTYLKFKNISYIQLTSDLTFSLNPLTFACPRKFNIC